jgi:hypothetical protein
MLPSNHQDGIGHQRQEEPCLLFELCSKVQEDQGYRAHYRRVDRNQLSGFIVPSALSTADRWPMSRDCPWPRMTGRTGPGKRSGLRSRTVPPQELAHLPAKKP